MDGAPTTTSINEMRFRLLINSMSDAVLALDANHRINLYNAATLDLLNRNTSVEGHTISSVITLKDKDKKAVSIPKLLEGTKGAFTSRDYLLKVEDDLINVYINISPVYTGYGHDEGRSYIVLIRDITKEKSLEEERDEFISVVSHELRTPVAIAEGNVSNAQFIAQKQGIDKTIIEAMTTAHSQILFLSDLLNDLSMLSRAERGNLEITLETLDIKHLVDELQTTYAPDAATHGLKLTVEHTGNLPKIKNSELYVREILQNFITNAIKYTREGAVTVRTKSAGGGKVEISVSDTGIGMSQHDLKHIFEKFYRSEDWRTRESSGTGLGLYVTHKLLEMTKAELSVASQLNKGSTFTIVLGSLTEAPKEKADEESPSD